MKIYPTIEFTIIRWILSTSEFRENGCDAACESCEPAKIAIKFTREQEQEKKKDYLYLFILFFVSNREISTCMVSLFFSIDVFWSFYPRDFLYLFIKVFFIGY